MAQVGLASGVDQTPLFSVLQLTLATSSDSVSFPLGMPNEVFGRCNTEQSFKAAQTDVISNGNRFIGGTNGNDGIPKQRSSAGTIL